MQNMWATFAKNPMGGPVGSWDEVGDAGFVEVIGGPGGLNSQGMLRKAGSAAEVDGGRCEIWRPVYRL